MDITITKALELLSSSDLNESLASIYESDTFKQLSNVKKTIKNPNDVQKFLDKNSSKIDRIEQKSDKKSAGLFSSCIQKLKYSLQQGKQFVKKHWGKILFLVCIVALGIFSYDQFKDKTSIIRKWFDKKDGVKDVKDDMSDDIFKRIAKTTSNIQNTGKNSKFTDKTLNSGQRLDIGASSSDEYLKQFYGNSTNDIVKSAVSKRLKTKDIPKDAKLYNTTFGTDVYNKGSFQPNRPDPIKGIKANNGRPHANWSDDTNNVFVSPGHSKYGSIEGQLGHELGHIYNAAENRGEIGKPDVLMHTAVGYHQANNHELGAALGDIRRTVYRNTNGKVDTASPEGFKEVLSNPAKYLPRDLQHVADEINKLQDYKGNDQKIIQRRDELKQKFNDPEFLGQFANAGKSSKNSNVAE